MNFFVFSYPSKNFRPLGPLSQKGIFSIFSFPFVIPGGAKVISFYFPPKTFQLFLFPPSLPPVHSEKNQTLITFHLFSELFRKTGAQIKRLFLAFPNHC